MTDKPRTHFSFSDLDKIDTPEPFVYTTKASKRVTFPDLLNLEFEEAEKFQEELQAAGGNAGALRKWLSEEDYERLRADRLSLRQVNNLVQKVSAHYEGAIGTQGEETASAS